MKTLQFYQKTIKEEKRRKEKKGRKRKREIIVNKKSVNDGDIHSLSDDDNNERVTFKGKNTIYCDNKRYQSYKFIENYKLVKSGKEIPPNCSPDSLMENRQLSEQFLYCWVHKDDNVQRFEKKQPRYISTFKWTVREGNPYVLPLMVHFMYIYTEAGKTDISQSESMRGEDLPYWSDFFVVHTRNKNMKHF